MRRLHNRAQRGHEMAAWEGPFSPPPAADKVTINPMVKTAAELASSPQTIVEHRESVAAHAA